MTTSTAALEDRPDDARATHTLMELVLALIETGATDREVVAAVIDLLGTRRIRLVGEVGEEHPSAPKRARASRAVRVPVVASVVREHRSPISTP